MIIRTVRHRGLRRLLEAGQVSGLPGAAVSKIVEILTFLQDMEAENELRSLAYWKPHRLTGDRAGVWALHVTKNWRLTFTIDQRDEIVDLDFEDYH